MVKPLLLGIEQHNIRIMRVLRICLAVVCMATAIVCSAQTGYKGSVEIGTDLSFDTSRQFKNRNHNASFTIGTVHGFQFNNHFFVGAGVEYNANKTDYLPIFGDIRLNLVMGKWRPFLDIRVGGEAISGDTQGAYFNPSIGAVYPLNSVFGLYMSLGYTNQAGAKYKSSDWHNCAGMTLRVGVEF